jgi:hypothetical protein
MSISTLWSEFKTWWEGTTIGQEIDAAGEATAKELESIAPADLETIVATTSTAILSGLAASSPTAAIISAGITAAENAFKAAGANVASTTVSTFTSALHNSITAQQSAGSVTPVAAA